MGFLLTEILVCFSTFLFIKIFLDRFRERQRLRSPPPSPKGYPFLGNTDVFAGPEEPCVKLRGIAKELGDIMTISVGPKRMLILSSVEAVREAFVKKAEDFSGRPALYSFSLLSRKGHGVAFGDYSASWKKHKREVSTALRLYLILNKTTSTQDVSRPKQSLAERVIMEETSHLCQSLAVKDGQTVNVSRYFTIALVNVVCKLTFGRRYEDDDPELWEFVSTNQKLKELFKPGHPIDVFPFLKIFPWQRLRDIEELIKTRDTIMKRELALHQKTFDPDNIRDLTDAFLSHGRIKRSGSVQASEPYSKTTANEMNDDFGDNEGSIMDEDAVLMAMWEIFAGGFESTFQTLRWAFAYIVNYPEVQARLHNELSSVLPDCSTPIWSDRSRLPYLHATVLETLRHSSLSSLNGPHRVSRDTQLGGYDVIKDTMVFCNLWWIHHDPANWKDPGTFNPANFLNATGAVTVPSYFMPFSVGTRMCLGDKLAKTSLFIFMGALLQNFRFEPKDFGVQPDLEIKDAESIRVVDEYEVKVLSNTHS